MACTALAASAALLPSARGLAARPRQQPAGAAARGRLAVRAAAEPPQSSGDVVQDLKSGAERMLARYDFVSAGMGALLVTGYCAARGQDVGTALWITAAATIVALVVNDLLPEDH
ncbi:hypothetical protein C2E20_2059 [Micractinium conductrix]|uniref:Uncharacterized protein n=1 Tax=Micractinium conductrix TaxID=554055 RepID=A0A2P6VL83_9CHLO|nr:hypothetical protein C2E20_2059 [Micractinium conductrix]|eukprot:PSC74861.1 hypothetical protein C2E20_2059 [Micractinium conductrix]